MRRSRLTRTSWLIPLGLALFLVALPAAAQVSTGTIEIAVVDTNGGVLPGVGVTAVAQDTGLSRSTSTDSGGMATLAALPPGTYDLSLALEGFAPVEQKDVVLRVGQTARIKVTMQLKTAGEIQVTAEMPVVDIYRSDTSTNIVPEQIEQLPVQNRDFEKLAFIAPGVQRERGTYRFIQGGPVIGSVGNASQSTVMVDGVDFTDEALGLARTRFSQDAIREFRVINNRFDAEVGNSAGGALSIVTKSGSNDVHGTVFGFYRSDSLRSTGELETGNQDFSRYQVGFTLGGPLVKDRTHYFVSTEYIDEDNISLFRPGGAFAADAEDVKHPFKQFLGFVSIDHQVDQSNSLVGKLVYENYEEDNFRVGGVCDVSCGMQLTRDNWNLSGGHTWVVNENRLNELRLQVGTRKYDEPANSTDVGEWFSSGTTLQTGANITGNIYGKGDYVELRDTYHMQFGGANGTHHLKIGGSIQWIDEESDIPVYPEGLFIYLTDDRSLPLLYAYGSGSADVSIDTTLYGLFVQDEWKPSADLSVVFGLRYDVDTNGNNPDFRHPLEPEKRDRDMNNIQPRVSFTWDMSGEGTTVLRGGVGQFTGRYLLVPAFTELQQNGISGRIIRSNLNGLIYGYPSMFWLDPNDPENSGIPLPIDSTLLESSLKAPEATQASLGLSQRIADTGLYVDLEALYAKGRNEIVVRDTNWGGNSNPVRPNSDWNQINMYTNQGRSEYKAFVASLNGYLKGGHLITASLTVGSKKNISDDFSPEFPYGYPSDPADIDAEWGRSRNDERYRVVVSGIFKLPWNVTLAPIYEYGSGQPWNHLLGYDYNGDGKTSDRPAGVKRNDMDGPDYKSLSLRITKTIAFTDSGSLDLIIEGFNILDNTNYDPNSVDKFEYLSGPTLANPTAEYVPNPNFGKYRATLDPREIQIGMRYRW